MQHLGPDAIDDPERDLGSVLGRVDMYAKRPLAEWRIDDPHDGFRDRTHISVIRHDSGESFLDVL